jgi:ribosome maturation protein Sdo1
MNKEGLTNYPRAIIQLINRREIMPVTDEPISESVAQSLKDGMKFTQDDLERIERLAAILGRCHEMVNKIEQFMSMRADVG